jgi:hypothetical protein
MTDVKKKAQDPTSGSKGARFEPVATSAGSSVDGATAYDTSAENRRTLATRIEAGKRAAAALHQATDELNKKLGAAAGSLCKLQLGVSAYVVVGREPTAGFVIGGDPDAGTYRLAFRKHDNEWGLFIEFPRGEVIPLLSASRELRVLAASKLPELIDRMLNAAESEMRQVSDSIAIVDNVLVELDEATS